jgi:hypothetical protein
MTAPFISDVIGPSMGILDCFDLDFADGPKALRESGVLDHMTTGFGKRC